MSWLTNKKHEQKSYFDIDAYINEVIINVSSDKQLTKQLNLINLTAEDLAILKQLQPLIQPVVPKMVERFYDAISLNSDLVDIINRTSRIERLKVTLTRHIQAIFECKIDLDYVKERIIIAHVHVKIDLKSKWYLASFQSLMSTFIEFTESLNLSVRDTNRAINAFNKVINLEQQLVIEAYEREELRIRLATQEQKNNVVVNIHSTAEELHAITVQTNEALEIITNESQQIVDSTAQGLHLVEETEQKSSTGTNHLQEQSNLMNNISERVITLDETMEKLRISSQKISEIVGLVTGIADQTNLLALNASIEAARAGDHGKGFAVVAQEVRKLAEETKSAVQNVSQLIAETESNITNMAQSVNSVESQVKLSVVTQEALIESFEDIVEAIHGIRTQYLNTSEDIQTISQSIAHLADTATTISASSDRLIETVNTLQQEN